MRRFLLTIPLVALLACCWLAPEKVTYSDGRVRDLLAARARVNPSQYGFTPVSPKADIRLEGRGRGYGAMLHVYGKTSRTIAFEKTSAGFRWIHEQEIHTGPREYSTPDGREYERIFVTYETSPVSGAQPRHLEIEYRGPDDVLAMRRNLTLAEVQPIFRAWDERP